jgi:5-methylcytosine-specific restriction endonuclease McrA
VIGEAQESRETLPFMNDTDLAAARTFHSRLVELLRAEFVSLGAFLEALAEFDRRMLFRDLGHANLFEYLHKGLKLSRAAAHHRRAGAWLVQRFPEVLEPIREGKLCFTTAAVLASVATEENLAAVLPRFYGLSKQEALELAAELKPRTQVPMRTVVTRVQASRPVDPPVEPVEEGKQTVPGIRPGELGMPRMEEERTDVKRTLVVPMTATSSRFHVTVSRKFLALLKRAKAGDSHRNPGASDEEVLTAALELLIEKQAKRKACVPAKVKREVVKRDQGKCQWKLPDGGVCGATAKLEVDHVVPRGKGGPSTVENCRILCKPHNLESARQAYGDAHMDLFTRGTSPGDAPLAREDVAGYGEGSAPPRLRPSPRSATIPGRCAASSDSSPPPTARPPSRSAAPRTRCEPSHTSTRTAGASPGTAPSAPRSAAA